MNPNLDAEKLADIVPPPALRRKLTAPTNPLDSAGMSPAKALRIAVARAFESAAELEVAVASFKETKETLALISKSLEEPHLIFSLKGPGGAVGLALWNLQAVAGLIEQLVTGRVVPSEAENRVPTATDAAVIRNVQNLILKKFDLELMPLTEIPPVAGFQCTGVFEDGRAVAMALEDLDYRCFRLTLDFVHGAKTAEIRLIFPWARAGALVDPAATGTEWAAAWLDTVHPVQASVSAILHRFHLPLDEITQLEVGGYVPVPAKAIGKVVLEGADGQAVVLGRLGQSQGHRAVRISGAVADPVENQDPSQFRPPDISAPVPAPLGMPIAPPDDTGSPAAEPMPNPANTEDTDGVPANQ